MSSRGVVRCVLAAVLFGMSAPAASRLADDLGAFALAGLLYLGAAMSVAPAVVHDPPSPAALRLGGARLAVAVVMGGAVGPVLLAAGLTHTSAATASLLLNLELAFTVVLAAVFFGEHLGRRVVTGTATVVAGGLVLAWSPAADLRIGALLIGGTCLCWAIDNCVTAALDQLAPSHITFVKGLIAGSVNLAIGIVATGSGAATSVAWALAVGAVGYGASITLWVSGARDLGAARGQLLFATAPFIGAVLAWTALGDQPTSRELAALVIAIAGVSLVLGSAHVHEHRHAPVEHDHEHRHDDGHHYHDHEPAVRDPHRHRHRHDPVVHHHPHVPDVHHRHGHGDVAA